MLTTTNELSGVAEATTTHDERSTTLTILGSITLISCVFVIACDFAGWAIVEKHNPISETISKLAIGDFGWIMDFGLNAFAVGLIATAIGMFRWSLGEKKWKFASFLLVLTAATVFVISEYDQYKGFDGTGADVHYGACYLLYAAVLASAICLYFELKAIGQRYSRSTLGFAILWFFGCPLFMFATPDSVDGAVERLLAIALVSWVAMLGWLVVQRGRDNIQKSI